MSDMMWPSLFGGGGGGLTALCFGDGGLSGNGVHGGTSGHNSGTLRVDGSGGTHSFLTPPRHTLDVGRGVHVDSGNSSLFT